MLYSPEFLAEETFVPNVQEIVKTLYDISQEIPSDSAADRYNVGRDLCLRTTASLHLKLFQVGSHPRGMFNADVVGNYSYNPAYNAPHGKTDPQRRRTNRWTAPCITTWTTVENLCGSGETVAESCWDLTTTEHDV